MIKTNFKKYLSEGIVHIEDMPIDVFIKMLDKIEKLSITQKLDGAALGVGLDEGKFFTSRELKGGKRFFSPEDYPDTSTYDGFRSAHQVLQKISSNMLDILGKNCFINCEILFGQQPNAIMYNEKDQNKLKIKVFYLL